MKNNSKCNYSDISDEEIIKLIKNGDTAAQDFILNKYKVLVRSKAKAYFLIGADNDDIIQEGMIGLYKAIRDFCDDKNTKFKSFADLCINRQIITAVKTATRQKHMPLNSYVSLNKQAFDEDSDETFINLIRETKVSDPETLFIGEEEKDSIVTHMEKALSEFEYKVLECYLNGDSYVEISKAINKSEKSIDNALQRIKKKIDKFVREKNAM